MVEKIKIPNLSAIEKLVIENFTCYFTKDYGSTELFIRNCTNCVKQLPTKQLLRSIYLIEHYDHKNGQWELE